MNFSFTPAGSLTTLRSALYFFKKHFWVITALGAIAAFGRVVQLGGFGAVSSGVNVLLEIVIEASRLLLVLYVLGLANVKKGLLAVKHFFTQKANRKLRWATALQKLKGQWPTILLNVAGFLLIAGAFNYLIDLLAYETCFYLSLKKNGLLSPSASEWTVLLFFKNLSTIPFTLVFETLLVLWLTGKISSYRKFTAY